MFAQGLKAATYLFRTKAMGPAGKRRFHVFFAPSSSSTSDFKVESLTGCGRANNAFDEFSCVCYTGFFAPARKCLWTAGGSNFPERCLLTKCRCSEFAPFFNRKRRRKLRFSISVLARVLLGFERGRSDRRMKCSPNFYKAYKISETICVFWVSSLSTRREEKVLERGLGRDRRDECAFSVRRRFSDDDRPFS